MTELMSPVSVLFSEPKIPQSKSAAASSRLRYVSVLFSEPKIPQFQSRRFRDCAAVSFSALQRAENSSINTPFRVLSELSRSFSALQRAENSSIGGGCVTASRVSRFQCSSASRKFLNLRTNVATRRSSIPFQCSSASRKFLNRRAASRCAARGAGFSALQRAENSSIG